MKRQQISIERLRHLVSYDQETGEFSWLNPTNVRIRAGARIGSIDKDGYLYCSIDKKIYKLHRLAWFWVTGEWPKETVDHINGVRSDNRFCNLRDVPLFINCHNKSVSKPQNKHGLMGVCWMEKRKAWVANICIAKRNKNLGDFETKEAAAQAYLEAKMKLHPGVAL